MPNPPPREPWLPASGLVEPSLRERSVRGGAVTLLGQAVRFVLQLASVAALSRLLEPADFGLVAMVVAITGFVDLLRDLGLSTATIQKAHLSDLEASGLFWVNVGAGVGLTAALAAASPLVAYFYGEPRLTAVTLALAAGFTVGGLGVQHLALLRRTMRFGTATAIDVTAQLFAVTVAIGSAWAGAGVWSLVALLLVVQVSTTAAAWVALPWRPRLHFDAPSLRPLLAMGGHLTGFNVINYLARRADQVLIGRFSGAVELGLYSRANQLLVLPIQQILQPVTGVVVPVLARLQNEPERFRRYFLNGLAGVCLPAFPLIGLTIVLADEVVLVMLGPSWGETALLFRLLAGAAIIQPLCNPTGWLYTSLGRTDRMLRWGIVYSALVLAGFAFGIRDGARGVASWYAGAMLLQAVPCLWYATQGTPVSLRDIFTTAAPPAAATLGAGLLAFFVNRSMLDVIGPAGRLLVAGSAAVALYSTLLALSGRQRAFYTAVWQTLRGA